MCVCKKKGVNYFSCELLVSETSLLIMDISDHVLLENEMKEHYKEATV